MILLLVALGLLCAGGAAALCFPRSPRVATAVGAGSAALGCALGLGPAVAGFAGQAASLRLAWSVPGGSLALGIDPLSAFFLLPLFGLSGLAAVYGAAYLGAAREGRAAGTPWFWFNLLVAGMAVVVTARNAVLFLVAWEVMSLASYFLVTREHERDEAREAGWTYLVATHVGTACLIVMFALLGAGSLDFDAFTPDGRASVLFVLALAGFGTKAGFVPLHVWLPEAHPAAPSHVSAVMSGVMIKMGIYGLLRTLTWLGAPPAWWGWTMIVVGVTSGLLGVLFALAQHGLKRLLAYHSVENIGIIALGLGVGLLGAGAGAPVMAALGFGGALLHVLNHALFKGLLFLGAGSVLRATGTGEMDRLGGLLRRMPLTSGCFLVGSMAIVGLPPLNGFVSEFLIFFGAMQNAGLHTLAVVGGLALISGLAAACFAKAFGAVFLGSARDARVAAARDPGPAMWVPVLVLAVACLAAGVGAPAVVRALSPVLGQVGGDGARASLDAVVRPLMNVTQGALAFIALVALVAGLRRLLRAGRPAAVTVTWDCGYANPTARMQYTASSFAQPITELFGPVLRTRRTAGVVRGLFPEPASFATETPDIVREAVYRPLFTGGARGLHALHRLQHGRLHLYVLTIAVTLVALLLWRLS